MGSIAQDPMHRRYTIQDGLPSNRVYCVIQDRTGFIWFGTDAGASRFDGRNFVNYSLADGLPDHEVIRIVEDSKGRIWFLTINGKLSYYEQGAIHHEGTDPSLRIDHRASGWQCLVEDVRGGIWIGGVYGGLLRLHADLSLDTLYQWPSGIMSLARDENDSIVVFQSAVVHRIAGRSTELVGPLDGMLYMSLVPDRLMPSRNALVLMDGGVHALRSDGLQCLIPTKELDHLFHRAAWEDRDGSIWIHRRASGIDVHRASDGRYEEKVTLFVGDNVNHALVDRDGIRWMATDRGVIMFSKAQESARNFALPGGHEGLLSLFVDKRERLWLGGDRGGLFVVGEHGLEKVELPAERAGSGRVMDIDGNEQGIWVATDHSLVHVDAYSASMTCRSIRFDHEYYKWPSRMREPARSVLCCRNGRVLCGGTGLHEMMELDKGTVRRFVRPDIIPFVRIHALEEDAEGGIWFENGNELFSLKDGELRTYPELNGLMGLRITDIVSYGSHGIVLATMGAGLVMVREGQLLHQVSEEGDRSLSELKRVRVYGDTIWTVGSGGAHAFMLDGDKLRRVRTITEREGLASNDARDVVLWKGRSVIGTAQGATVVDAGAVPQSMPEPVPYFHEVLVGDSAYSLTDGVVLDPDADLRVTVRSIAFLTPELVQYQYRMLPDTEWRDMPGGTIDYVGPRSRDRRLEVRSRVAKASWGRVIGFPVRVVPPWYLNGWAIALFMLSLVGGSVGMVLVVLKWRHRKEVRRASEIRMLDQERRRIAADVHDDLGADLSHLLGQARRLQEGEGEVGRLVHDIGRSVDRIDEIIWSLDPERDNVRSTAEFIEHWVRDYAHVNGLVFRSNIQVGPGHVPMHTKQRRELALVVKEAMRNIVKHAEATQVHLIFRMDEFTVRLELIDDGRVSPVGNGTERRSGTANMERRIHSLGGRIGKEAVAPHGTRLIIELDGGSLE